jgi:hypothetical protein
MPKPGCCLPVETSPGSRMESKKGWVVGLDVGSNVVPTCATVAIIANCYLWIVEVTAPRIISFGLNNGKKSNLVKYLLSR